MEGFVLDMTADGDSLTGYTLFSSLAIGAECRVYNIEYRRLRVHVQVGLDCLVLVALRKEDRVQFRFVIKVLRREFAAARVFWKVARTPKNIRRNRDERKEAFRRGVGRSVVFQCGCGTKVHRRELHKCLGGHYRTGPQRVVVKLNADFFSSAPETVEGKCPGLEGHCPYDKGEFAPGRCSVDHCPREAAARVMARLRLTARCAG